MLNRYRVSVVLILVVMVAVATLQAQNSPLIINHAQWGKGGVGADVTRKVRSMIQNHQLDIKVNNSNLGGDPNVGTDKVLTIKYSYQGQTHVKVCKEGERCQLP